MSQRAPDETEWSEHVAQIGEGWTSWCVCGGDASLRRRLLQDVAEQCVDAHPDVPVISLSSDTDRGEILDLPEEVILVLEEGVLASMSERTQRALLARVQDRLTTKVLVPTPTLEQLRRDVTHDNLLATLFEDLRHHVCDVDAA